MAVNNFDVLKKMSADNKDIRLGIDFLRGHQTKLGSQVTYGIGGNVLTGLMTGELAGCLLIWNRAQFKEAKEQLEAEESDESTER